MPKFVRKQPPVVTFEGKIVRKPDESFDTMYKRFKRMVVKEGILLEWSDHSYYISKGQRNRMKRKAAIMRSRKK